LWYADVSTSSRTPSYRSIPTQRAMLQAVYIYKNLKDLYFNDQPYQAILEFLMKKQYAELLYEDNIPVHEAVYSLILMRRHIWLFSELRAVYSDTAVEMHLALESVNRVVLLFDYIIYILAHLYHELENRGS
ncbi:MAG: hypothetical protein JSV32_01045, partial [Dehalococcoidia bacterium]